MLATMALTPHAEPEHRGELAAHSRGALIGFLGSIVRPLGDWMPIGAAVELLGQAGVDESSVRTGVSRLKQRAWLAPEARGGARGYALTARATAALRAGDDVVWHARRPADLADGWCIVHFSVPESARTRRTRLRSRLAALGFGNVGSAMWIAPARMLEEARRAIDELELTGQCALFLAPTPVGSGRRSSPARAGISLRSTRATGAFWSATGRRSRSWTGSVRRAARTRSRPTWR